jgi:hypothetical protein
MSKDYDDAPPWSDGEPSWSPELMDQLRAADRLLAPDASKHDRAIVLITVCIENEVDVGSQIVAVLAQFGFNPRHIGICLKEGTGNGPPSYWTKDTNGRYRNRT